MNMIINTVVSKFMGKMGGRKQARAFSAIQCINREQALNHYCHTNEQNLKRIKDETLQMSPCQNSDRKDWVV